jgi:hypothetical protein
MFGAALLMLVSIGLVCAEEFTARISKVGDGKITFTKLKKGEKGEEATLAIAADVKVVNAKFNKDTKTQEAGDPVPDGIKNKMFTNIGEKGVTARLVTDDSGKKVTEIRVFKGFGKKKKDAN